MDVGADAGGELQAGEADVVDTRLDEGEPSGRDLRRSLVEEVQHDRHVVRSEVPQCVAVTADAAEAEPLRIEVLHSAELTRGDELTETAYGRRVQEGVT